MRPDPLPSHELETIILQSSVLQRFTAESSRGTQCLEEAEQQAEASVDVPYPPLQIVNKDFKFHYILFHQWHIF